MASVTCVTDTSVLGLQGKIEGIIAAHNNTSAQQGFVNAYAFKNWIGPTYATGNPYTQMSGNASGNSSVNSSSDQDLIITGVFANGTQKNSIMSGMFVVEKIV